QNKPTSRMTLLRLVRALAEPPIETPRALGVDEFAFRRGRRYGTTDKLGRRKVANSIWLRSADGECVQMRDGRPRAAPPVSPWVAGPSARAARYRQAAGGRFSPA